MFSKQTTIILIFIQKKHMDIVQLISTLLEGIGLILAILDMRYPNLMKQLEKSIDWCGDTFENFVKANKEALWFQISFSGMVLSILLIGGFWLFGSASIGIFWWIIFWVFVIAGGSMIFIALIGDFIALLNKFSVYDLAITTFGVFLATIGFILGVLQLFGIL